MIQVNQITISEDQILKEMQYHPAKDQRDAMIKASEALVISELVKQKAQKLNVDWDADDEESVIQKLLTIEVTIPTADEAACQKYFEQNPERFSTTPLLMVSHILLTCPPEDANGRLATRETAKDLIAQIKADSEVFMELVQAYSKCPSAKEGGSLGQIGKDQTVPEFERQLFNCSEGLAEAPIESRYGVHVVRVDRRVDGKPLEYSMVSERIESYLNDRVLRRTIAQYIETLISAAKIEGFSFNLGESQLMH